MQAVTTESLADWATRVAPTLNAAGWREQERVAASNGMFPAKRVAEARALLAERDRVAAGLTGPQKRLLAEAVGNAVPENRLRRLLGGGACRTFGVLSRLKLATLRSQIPYVTAFGREIARVLGSKT